MAISLGLDTADATLYTGQGRISSVTVLADGTNVATAILYDNTAASGNVLFKAAVIGADYSRTFNFTHPVQFKTGIQLDITGTGAAVVVHIA